MFLIYHNPRWSKSRESVKILNENKIDFKVINYIKDGLKKTDVAKLCKILNLSAIELIRKSDSNYRDLGITVSQESNEGFIISTISENPQILQRPIITNGERGVIGRPPEKILELL